MLDCPDDFHRENSSFLAFGKKRVTQGRNDRPTDGPTDGRTGTTSYRDARTRLKRKRERTQNRHRGQMPSAFLIPHDIIKLRWNKRISSKSAYSWVQNGMIIISNGAAASLPPAGIFTHWYPSWRGWWIRERTDDWHLDELCWVVESNLASSGSWSWLRTLTLPYSLSFPLLVSGKRPRDGRVDPSCLGSVL